MMSSFLYVCLYRLYNCKSSSFKMVNYVTMMIALILELAKGKLKRSKKKKASSTNQVSFLLSFCYHFLYHFFINFFSNDFPSAKMSSLY